MDFQHPQLGIVRIVPHVRAKRLMLSVKPSGEVRLSHPPHFPQKELLKFIDQRIAWIEQARARMAARRESMPQSEPLKPEAIEELRRRAKEQLPSRVEQLATQFGFRYGRVSIRAARTKWGCCTGRNNLSLSLYLMLLPESLRHFVILHELCHTVHHNHSPKFHALLNQCVEGQERALIHALKSYRIP